MRIARVVASPPASRRRRERGFIIVAVLWIMLALSTLASIYTAYVVRTAYAVGASDDRIAAEALFTAAIELTAYQMTAEPKEKRKSHGRADLRIGRAALTIDYRSEAGRIDLNQAPKPLLSSLFASLGASPQNADDYAARIMAWRSRSGANTQSGANAAAQLSAQAGPQPAPQANAGNAQGSDEAEAYRAAGRSYKPRQASFQSVDELWLVLNLPPAVVERVLPYVTVYSGAAQVNILDASPLVLAALPGMDPRQVNAVLAARQEFGVDGKALIASAGLKDDVATVDASPTVRVTVGVQFDNGARASAEIVILVSDDGEEPYRVLFWRDDFDQVAPAGS
jgi:general secretion pathway protein K